MTEALQTARRLLEQTGDHPVLSLYLDLDPTEFATAPARATQLRSLIDEARSSLESGDTALSHDERRALIDGIERVESFLSSEQAPVAGARALAVFCSPEDGLFETVKLYEPAPARVVIAPRPYLEPLVSAAASLAGAWCVALVNRSTARILAGQPGHLWERGELDDDVKGQHRQGGWSQARYERSVDVEVERHLQHVAQELRLRLEREPFETLVLGGPEETVARLAEMLHGDVKPRLSEHRLSVDVENATAGQIRDALAPLLELHRHGVEQAALERLREAQGAGGGRAVSGVQDTQLALTERRVQTLLLSPAFAGGEGPRSEAIESAILQSAGVIVFEEPPPETHLREGIGALLRF
jgi:peptide chain release factor subunit 1